MIIGIGGVSRAGKTDLAKGLGRHFRAKGQSVCILHQDEFVFPEEAIPKIRDRTDWEDPASIDFERFYDAIRSGAETYDVVIAEGLLVFYDPRIDLLFDRRLFIEIGRDTFLERKSRDRRWGEEPAWYIEHIWDSYLHYGQPHDPEQIFFMNGERPVDWPRVLEALR